MSSHARGIGIDRGQWASLHAIRAKILCKLQLVKVESKYSGSVYPGYKGAVMCSNMTCTVTCKHSDMQHYDTHSDMQHYDMHGDMQAL
eukprot:1159271-Pelagomonas_calceolata.AAC.8